MQNYNVLVQKFALLALTGLTTVGMTACTLPKSTPSTNSSDAGGATFTVSSMQADFTSTKTEPSFAIPVSKTLSFKACVNDIQYSKAIMGHKFLITSDSEQVETTSDNSGCMVWQEEIPYNHIANSKYVQIDRTMIAKGFQKGSRVISFAINPWEGKALSLKDNKVQNLVSADQAQVHLKGNGDTKALWLQSPVANILQKEFSSYRTVYSIEFLAEPKFITKDSGNQTIMNSIAGGQYDLQFYIFRVKIGTNGKTREMVAQPQIQSADSLRFGKIAKTFDVNLPGGCSLCQYELGVKITPKNTTLQLAPFQGVYSLGQGENILGPKSLRFMDEYQQLAEKGEFSIEKYAKDAPPAAANSEGVLQSAIQIGPVTPVFPITYDGKSVFEKEKHFKLRFCAETADGHPIRNHDFKVTGLNGNTQSYKTNIDGCILNAADSFSFNIFAKECWIKKSITIQSDTLGVREIIPVAYNSVYEFGNFVLDLRQNENDPINGKCAEGDSKIIAESFAFDKVRYDYDVDPYLGIKVHKKGVLRIAIRLNRPSITTAFGAENLNLPVGKYKLRWAVVDSTVKDYKNAAGKIYAAGEKEVTTNSNSAIQIDDFDLNLTNIKAIGNTNHIIFEVVPLGMDGHTISGLKTVPLRAPINIQNNSEGNTVVPQDDLGPIVENLANQYKVDQERILTEAKKISTKEFFAQDNRIQLLNLNDSRPEVKQWISDVGFNRDELKTWVMSGNTSKELANKLCSHWIRNVLKSSTNKHGIRIATVDMATELLDNCSEAVAKDPRNFFHIEFRYFLNDIKKVADLRYPTRDLSISQSFSLSNNYSFSDSQSISMDVGGSLSAKSESSPFSASLGARYSFMNYSWSHSQSWGNSISVSSGSSATIEQIGFKIEAQSYEKCAVIKLNPTQIIDSKEKAYDGKSIAGFFHNIFQLPLLQSMTSNLSVEDRYKIADRGYMFCTGEKTKPTEAFVENYYTINQKTSVTQMTDNSSDDTRAFFIALRGRGDLGAFISQIQGSEELPNSFKEEYLQNNLLFDPTMQVFKRGFRSYPGQIVAPK